MKVRLTHLRLEKVSEAVPARVAEELHAEVTPVTDRFVMVNAAFVAWEIAQQAIIDLAYSERGSVKGGVPASLVNALEAITRGINAYERHPALRGAGVIGHPAPVTFPVWEFLDPQPFGALYSPRPIEAPFVVLRPHLLTESGRRVTVWNEHGIAPSFDRLADEEVHKALLRQSLP